MSKDSDTLIQQPTTVPEHATVINLHSVKNLLGHENQLTLFSEHNVENFSKIYGIKVKSKIDRFGIELNETQARVMEGILRGFSETNYKGNLEPKNKKQLVRDRYAFGDLPSTYKYVNEIPCLKATQSQILAWAGVNKNSIAEKERAVEALKHLGVAQYCFYYDRLALDKHGMPEKDSEGKWKKEEVIAVDTLFVIKEIRDQKDGSLEYYEIIPSPIFLDQRESYFMLIPYNWREEVRELVGNKRASSYTFRFLLFLRYQYELKRRHQKDEMKPFTIRWGWEEIAIAIKMPESVYKRKKDRAKKILDDAYFVAKQLGYLKDYKREVAVDCLILNEEKYYPKKDSDKIESQDITSNYSSEAFQLFQLFHEEKSKKAPTHKLPKGKTQDLHLIEFEKLLNLYCFSKIRDAITFGFGKKQWITRISTPSKLRENFNTLLHQLESLTLF
ncbi:hypothetical protein [Candidatus Protochlamydia phocaeensis]|uniref:hypothetical protein n=1 Tax=Candidatus Protochlamydia phocaeensis TaxID=1414722 RepID=UPI000837D43A|nr:hypothetical protein [Candidatus Protochlamydia phocaeensis]